MSFSKDKSAAAIMGAIFFWFFGWNAIETWFTKYGSEVLGFSVPDASFLLNGIALSFVVFAVPSGFIAGKFGRKNTILAGLVIMIVSLGLLWVITDYLTILGVLAIAGIGWALINVNSIVMLWEHLGQSRVGAGTGLYYAASMGAAIIGPVVSGVLFDLFGIGILYPLSIVFFVVAFFLTMAIKTGEVGDAAIA
ncbi:MAG: MFS transporter [Candidatus Thorarchaeota archaeon]